VRVSRACIAASTRIRAQAFGDHVADSASSPSSCLRMKTERKYSEPTVFVFYIMISFSNIKKLSVLIGFTTIFNHFLYSLIARM
jgi:hypothetical protein